ncbi:hypothetical protein ACP4OV_017197 [Aristida adscensionis]
MHAGRRASCRLADDAKMAAWPQPETAEDAAVRALLGLLDTVRATHRTPRTANRSQSDSTPKESATNRIRRERKGHRNPNPPRACRNPNPRRRLRLGLAVDKNGKPARADRNPLASGEGAAMSAADALGLPPGLAFRPTDAELVVLYLLPRARGGAPPLPGVVAEGPGASAAVPPWRLLQRHGRSAGAGADEGLCFFERNARSPARGCGGGRWTWVGQKRYPAALALPGGGGRLEWTKFQLNLHPGDGRRSGSTGWVMHEYTISKPPGLAAVKLCHVAFSGHGRKRQRVPDDDDGELESAQVQLAPPQAASPPQRKRVAAAAATSPSSTTSTTTALADQELDAPLADNNREYFLNLGDSSDPAFWVVDDVSSQEPRAELEPFSLDPPLPPLVDQQLPAPLTDNQEHFLMDQELTVPPLAGNQEHFLADQEHAVPLAQNQEHFLVNQELVVPPLADKKEHLMNQPQQDQYQDVMAYCALLASDAGSGQEETDPVRQPLTQEHLMQQQLHDLLGNVNCSQPGVPCAAPANAEEHLQTPAPAPATGEPAEPGTLPPAMGEELPELWEDLEALLAVPDSPAGNGSEDHWDWESALQEPEE